jgi:hypothetical protein
MGPRPAMGVVVAALVITYGNSPVSRAVVTTDSTRWTTQYALHVENHGNKGPPFPPGQTTRLPATGSAHLTPKEEGKDFLPKAKAKPLIPDTQGRRSKDPLTAKEVPSPPQREEKPTLGTKRHPPPQEAVHGIRHTETTTTTLTNPPNPSGLDGAHAKARGQRQGQT